MHTDPEFPAVEIGDPGVHLRRGELPGVCDEGREKAGFMHGEGPESHGKRVVVAVGSGERAELGDGATELLAAGVAAEMLLAGDVRGIAGGAEFRDEAGSLGGGGGGHAGGTFGTDRTSTADGVVDFCLLQVIIARPVFRFAGQAFSIIFRGCVFSEKVGWP